MKHSHKCQALKRSIEVDKPRLSQLCFRGGGGEEKDMFSDKIRPNLASQTKLVIVRQLTLTKQLKLLSN